MTGKLTLNEKLAENNHLYVKSPLLRIAGERQADLAADELDYLVATTVAESAREQGGDEARDLRGVAIPVLVSGSLRGPVHRLEEKLEKLLD